MHCIYSYKRCGYFYTRTCVAFIHTTVWYVCICMYVSLCLHVQVLFEPCGEWACVYVFARVCVCVCVRAVRACDVSPPCGVMVWIGLAVTRTFQVVRVPSEWLHTNCFPSWCQATEWMACSTHTHRTHTRTHKQKHTHTYQNICKVGTVRRTTTVCFSWTQEWRSLSYAWDEWNPC